MNMMAPGRLGDSNMTLDSDPRLHPNIRAAFPGGGNINAVDQKVTSKSPMAEILKMCAESEKTAQGLYDNIPLELPGDESINVEESTETIEGMDYNDIKLHIYRPSGVSGPLPCVVYTHGGGMVIINTYNRVHNQWRKDIAALGAVTIGVDFRNAYMPDGSHNPFPAGLNDCWSAVQWIHEHRAELGISKIVIQGESGGGNLALATALKAKKEGRMEVIDGVYAIVPYISGEWGQSREWKLEHYPSLVENAGYLIDPDGMAIMAACYDPERKEAKNPLAWPGQATVEDLKGLPPHVITVDELDPLRDEGIAHYRKLTQAGVRTVGKMNLGLIHGAELILRIAIPDICKSMSQDIKRFADSL